MELFGPPNIEKLKAKQNVEGTHYTANVVHDVLGLPGVLDPVVVKIVL